MKKTFEEKLEEERVYYAERRKELAKQTITKAVNKALNSLNVPDAANAIEAFDEIAKIKIGQHYQNVLASLMKIQESIENEKNPKTA